MSDEFALTSPVPVGGRESHDHYPTPRWCVLALLGYDAPPDGAVVLDPACGEGAILDLYRERGHATLGIEADSHRAYAARGRGHRVAIHDALALDWDHEALQAAWIVGNPPYTLAAAFAWKAAAWAERAPGRRACLLLRLSFLEPASGRGVLFEHHRPDVLILPRRPSFDGRGTDSSASAWFCWPGQGRLVWLPS